MLHKRCYYMKFSGKFLPNLILRTQVSKLKYLAPRHTYSCFEFWGVLHIASSSNELYNVSLHQSIFMFKICLVKLFFWLPPWTVQQSVPVQQKPVPKRYPFKITDESPNTCPSLLWCYLEDWFIMMSTKLFQVLYYN